MKILLKYRLLALLLAIFTASFIGALLSPSRMLFSKKLGFNFGSILIFGFPVYILFTLLHYWLCNKSNRHGAVISTIIGIVLALTIWLIITLAQQEPDEHGLNLSSMVAYVAAGAVYGFVSEYFHKDTATV